MSLKSLVLGTDRSRVSLPSVFYLLKKAKNVMGAKYNNFHFFSVFEVLQCMVNSVWL